MRDTCVEIFQHVRIPVGTIRSDELTGADYRFLCVVLSLLLHYIFLRVFPNNHC